MDFDVLKKEELDPLCNYLCIVQLEMLSAKAKARHKAGKQTPLRIQKRQPNDLGLRGEW